MIRSITPGQALKYLAVLPLALIAAMIIGVPLDATEQWMFAGVVIAGTLVLKRWKGRKGSLALGLLSVLVSTRYIVWRTTQTLSFGTLPEFLLGTGLYLAELYAWVILILGFLQTSWPLNRPVIEPEGTPDQWPTVDIYIPTYNESLDIVRNTVFAAMDLDYPVDRYNVYILDDGKRPDFRAFAKEAGCGYITRDNNLHAKAGNLNAAMTKTDGELIAIFDCDHVPTRSFLQLTVGWFQKDPRLALLQTPHHMYSPDPVQRNLAQTVGEDMPGEGDLFYGAVQEGNDLWNATFFCGSCAIIRREALMETNGFAGETVTEDAHTALKLQRTGWNTAYIGARLSAGLATERLVLHVGQRIRWARGMTQILRIDCPLLGRGLSWQQRLCYLNAMMHFQYPLPRIVFLTSPLAYLLFGQNIIQSSAALIFAYALPHLFCSNVANEKTQGSDRNPYWGEIYETILAFHLVKPTVMTWFQPRKGKFNVTDKGSLLDKTYFDWEIVRPHLICIGILIAGIALGFAKLIFLPYMFNIQLDTLVLNSAWAGFSLIILLAAVSVARETRQVREQIRVRAHLPVTAYLASGHVVPGHTIDISMGGAAVALPEKLPVKDRELTHLTMAMGDEVLSLPVTTVRTDARNAYVRFDELDMMASRHLVRAVMGRSNAWQPEGARKPTPTLRSLGDIVRVDMTTMGRLLHLNRKERRKMREANARAAAKASDAKTLAKAAGIAATLALGSATIALSPRPAQAQTAATAAVPATPVVDTLATAVDGAMHQRLTLKDLRIDQPIRLQGTRGEIGIPFGMRQDRVVSGAVLTVKTAWSPALLSDLSQLVVILNGEVIQTIPLTKMDSRGRTFTIPVNPALFLPGDNQLNLRLIGHYTRDCEDPFHSSLWANISNVGSWLDLNYAPVTLAPDLSRLPLPFFDKGQNSTLKVPFVFAGQPHKGQMQAAAATASWLGSLASYRGFSFKPSFGSIPTGNAVVFLLGQESLPGLNIAPASGPEAAVVQNPNDPNGTLLVIMGRDEQELRTAASAVALGKGVFGGQRMSFDGARIPTWPRYGALRWISTEHAVKLGDIMQAYEMQGMGIPPGPLTARFRAAPDLFFWPRQGGKVNLTYRYPVAEWLDKRASRLDISINGQYLKTLPLSADWWSSLFNWGGSGVTSRDARASVTLPRYALFGQNQLAMDYNLVLADKKACTGTLPDNVRVSVDPQSTIDLSSAYHGLIMPDLAPFAGAGFPFTVQPDLAETTVIMASAPTPATVEAFLDLMGRFGDSTGVPATAVTVTSEVNPERLKAQEVLVIGSTNLASQGSLFENSPLTWNNGHLRVAERSALQNVTALFGGRTAETDEKQAEPLVYSARGFTGIVSFRNPFADDRTVVAVLSDDAESLPAMVESLQDTKVNASVQGDLAVMAGDGMASFALGDTYWVGSLPVWMQLAYWFSGRPVMMGLFTLMMAVLLASPAYYYFRRQAANRLQNAGRRASDKDH